MKVKKQINMNTMKDLGFTGSNPAEIEELLYGMVQSTEDNLDRRHEACMYQPYGIPVKIPRSVIAPVQLCCENGCGRYRFIYRMKGNELLNSIISHYLFNDEVLSKNDTMNVINKSIEECQRIGLVPETVSSNISYLQTWLIYNLNQILTDYIS